MRQILLLIATFTVILVQTRAQVTIGSNIEPNAGAILDLKEKEGLGANSTRGLSLPKVQLTTILSLDDINTNLDKDAHIGLAIYVPKEFENSCPGVYVWTGTVWEGINTDASRAPEFITETDVDGNIYTAKIFNRKGCKGGVYWFTSNLRTTRFNDGTPVKSTKNYDKTNVSSERDDNMPMFLHDGKVNTWEVPPYDPVTNTNYYDESTTKLIPIRTKSDISTTKMIEYYENGTIQRLTQDQFATKFGLLYIYNMAFDGDYKGGGTIVERKLCPSGWKIPSTIDWINVIRDMGAPDVATAAKDAAEYLGTTNLIEGIDVEEIFASGSLTDKGYLSREAPHPVYNITDSWDIRRPKAMSEGKVPNSGLNIYALGSVTLPSSVPLEGEQQGLAQFVARYRGFGENAFFLNVANGAIYISPYRYDFGGVIDQMTGSIGASSFSSVRCIKVVE